MRKAWAMFAIGLLLGVGSTLVASVIARGVPPYRILPDPATSKLVGKWQCTATLPGDCRHLGRSMELLGDGTFIDDERRAHRYTVVDGKKLRVDFVRSGTGSITTVVYDFYFTDDGRLRIDLGSRVDIYRRTG